MSSDPPARGHGSGFGMHMLPARLCRHCVHSSAPVTNYMTGEIDPALMWCTKLDVRVSYAKPTGCVFWERATGADDE